MATGDVVSTHLMVNNNPDLSKDRVQGHTLPSDWNAQHVLEGMSEFQSAVKDTVLIDMGSDNYTMTLDESIAPIKIIINGGTGKTITYDLEAFNYMAPRQVFVSSFTSDNYTIDNGNGNTAPAIAGYAIDVVVISTSITSLTGEDGRYARQLSPETIKLTSQALEGTPLAGDIEYLTNALYYTPSASNRALVPVEHFACLSAAVSLADDTSTQDIFGATYGEFNAVANTSYRVEGDIITITGTDPHRTDFGIGGTATVDSIQLYVDTYAGALGSGGKTNVNGTIGATGIQPISFSSTAAGEYKHFTGIIRVSTAGTLKPQIKFSSAPGGGANTVAINSYVKYTPLGSNTAASTGNFT